jgi:hypothetical protein
VNVRNPRFTFVVGVDPGVSTGLVVVRGDGFCAHREQGPPSVLYDFNDRFPFLRHPGVDVLVACERFVDPPGGRYRSAQPVAQQVVGAVSQLCVVNGWRLYLQSPADAKSMFSNDELRAYGLYWFARDVDRPDANDVNDATRHALLLLAQRRATMFDALTRVTTV